MANIRNLSRLTNKQLMIQQLFNHPQTSRAELARILNLNKSTVSAIFNDLNKTGLIKSIGLGDSTNSGGRRPHLITVNKRCGWVACFDIGGYGLRSLVTYLNGEMIQVADKPLDNIDVNELLQEIDRMMAEFQANDDTDHGLLGIGFSVHGIVYQNHIQSTPFFDFKSVDLQKYFQDKYGVPVILENEANAVAIFEHDFGMESDIDDLITISIHAGLGVGIIVDGQLYRGYRGLAGEIGRQLVRQPGDLSNSLVKVESLCSEKAIMDRFRQLKRRPNYSTKQLCLLYKQGDTDTVKVIDDAVSILTGAIYNAIVAYGPQEVYLNSPLMESLPDIFQKVRHRLVALNMNVPVYQIKGSRYPSLLGASSLIIHHVLGMENYSLKFKWPKEVNHRD